MKKLPVTISEKEFLLIVKNINNKKLKLAFMLGFYQCMRVSEVVKLKPLDVDKDRGYLHIKNAKGGKDRDVPIMSPVKRGLGHLPIDKSVRTLQRAIKEAGKKYLDKDIHFHTLRHSGASTYLNEKNINIRYLQQLLGHSRLDTTMIYTHVTPGHLKKKFDEVWE